MLDRTVRAIKTDEVERLVKSLLGRCAQGMNVSVQNPSVDGERSGPVPQFRQLGGDQFEISPGNGSDLKHRLLIADSGA